MKRVVLDKAALPPEEGSWTDADAAACLSLYETMMRGHDGFRIRDLTYYQDFWLPYQACCGMRVQVFLHEGQAEGYACWESGEEERLISELVCTSEAAALRMLASLTSADKTTAAIVSPKLNIPGKSETGSRADGQRTAFAARALLPERMSVKRCLMLQIHHLFLRRIMLY